MAERSRTEKIARLPLQMFAADFGHCAGIFFKSVQSEGSATSWGSFLRQAITAITAYTLRARGASSRHRSHQKAHIHCRNLRTSHQQIYSKSREATQFMGRHVAERMLQDGRCKPFEDHLRGRVEESSPPALPRIEFASERGRALTDKPLL